MSDRVKRLREIERELEELKKDTGIENRYFLNIKAYIRLWIQHIRMMKDDS